MSKEYRNGPVGALMDEYERAAAALKTLVRSINKEDFLRVIDHETQDPDCRSIQTIMNHVVCAGYGYANYIRKEFGNEWVKRRQDYGLGSPNTACNALDNMFAYTLETMEDKWDLNHSDLIKPQINVPWGPVYDFEQLVEHAIVHILRHRRQIEWFLLRIA